MKLSSDSLVTVNVLFLFLGEGKDDYECIEEGVSRPKRPSILTVPSFSNGSQLENAPDVSKDRYNMDEMKIF